MDFWKTLKILFSRWYIALPVFLVACIAAVGVFVSTPTYYTSTGLVLLTTPPAGGVLDPDAAHRIKLNPLLGFDDLLKVVELVQQLFQDQRQVLDPLRLGWLLVRLVGAGHVRWPFRIGGCWWWSWL